MRIINGKEIASKIYGEVKEEVGKLSFQPVFCDVLVGEDPASRQYVGMKARAAQRLGFKFRSAEFPSTVTTEVLIGEIKSISQEPNMRGLIVQLPLPATLPRREILDAIEPEIDVDCMGSKNLGDFYRGEIRFVPPTAAAIMTILDSLNTDLSLKNFLVVGQGELVGRPAAFLLKRRGFKVNVADVTTKNTAELLKSADVVISAAGKAGLITGSKIRPGAVIIDAGTSESEGGIVGDVDFATIRDIAGAVSPVPGGVGPVTVAQLLANVVLSAQSGR
ncbi:MAG: bifunctional 5,10-methylenetetrahydrofolate dehydrogenase/5,10-methenyltetrahydrofolate cyclohydrolase [Candidatus Doudnabacteria bacterium]|nr:bifunctional 5,10-methylenetetrahydrofolate dehydrogenase/5,10-methenyltetrahydrofolate cyclohydrolase [Candidatus Doudnabacteria bacterium]